MRIFSESFEEAGTWPGITALDNTMSKTGKYSARIDNSGTTELTATSAKLLTVSLSAPTKYKYSGWFYSNGPSADLFLLMNRANETGYATYADNLTTSITGKWVYMEKEFMVPADVVQMKLRIDNNSSGTVWYDEIRLNPSAAQLTTYTYDLLYGMTSQTDPNGKITYYEYDSFNRLKYIRDQDNNIIKKFCYNYAGQVEDCAN